MLLAVTGKGGGSLKPVIPVRRLFSHLENLDDDKTFFF
jgi:hypothetical protein